ncbi:MAG: histidine phosphatase family protein, partial [Rhodospirillaceae bacterium]|nr:histidine phosphatase family protein [Rhodospirillaceae bacterium]
DRPLAPRGRRAAAVIGVYLHDEGLAPDLVLCSGALRARQTWEAAAAVFGRAPAVEYEPQLYLATPERLLKRLQQLPDAVETVLLVGHEGGVDALARRLARTGGAALKRLRAEKYPTAGFAVVVVDIPHWAGLRENTGALDRFETPKGLV